MRYIFRFIHSIVAFPFCPRGIVLLWKCIPTLFHENVSFYFSHFHQRHANCTTNINLKSAQFRLSLALAGTLINVKFKCYLITCRHICQNSRLDTLKGQAWNVTMESAKRPGRTTAALENKRSKFLNLVLTFVWRVLNAKSTGLEKRGLSEILENSWDMSNKAI